jgi:hypothetical protein
MLMRLKNDDFFQDFDSISKINCHIFGISTITNVSLFSILKQNDIVE